MRMKLENLKKILIGIVIAIVLIGIGVYWIAQRQMLKTSGYQFERKEGMIGTTTPADVLSLSVPVDRDEAAEWKTYRNEKYGFEFKYPDGWTVERRSSVTAEGFFIRHHLAGTLIDVLPQGGLDSPFPDNATISVEDFQFGGRLAKKYVSGDVIWIRLTPNPNYWDPFEHRIVLRLDMIPATLDEKVKTEVRETAFRILETFRFGGSISADTATIITPIVFFTQWGVGPGGKWQEQVIRFYSLDPSTGKESLLYELIGPYHIISAAGKSMKVPLVTPGGELLTLNLISHQLASVTQAPHGKKVRNVEFFGNDKIIFIVEDENSFPRVTNSELWIVDISSGRRHSLLLSKESALYAGFEIVGKDESADTVLLSEGGTEAGGGALYIVDLHDLTIKKAMDIVDKIPISNPAGTKLAFASSSVVYDPSILYPSGCLKSLADHPSDGETIIIRDVVNGKEDEVYRNLSHRDDYCRTLLRKIWSVAWKNNEEILFITPDGVYVLAAHPKNARMIHQFRDPPVDDFRYLVFANDNIAVLSDRTFIDLKAERLMALPKRDTEIHLIQF